MRPQAFHSDQDHKRRECNAKGEQRRIGEVMDQADQIAQKAFLGDVKPEQLGHLVENDNQANAGLEPGQNRCRDEVGDKAQSQQSGQRENDAGHCGQGRDRSHEPCRVTIGHHQGELGAGENGQGGG